MNVNIWYYSAIYQKEINDPLLLDRVCVVINFITNDPH